MPFIFEWSIGTGLAVGSLTGVFAFAGAIFFFFVEVALRALVNGAAADVSACAAIPDMSMPAMPPCIVSIDCIMRRRLVSAITRWRMTGSRIIRSCICIICDIP
ncbi:MAG: hypothetical protein ABIT20_19945, partial [Gemmatimonadaceae bacterium]